MCEEILVDCRNAKVLLSSSCRPHDSDAEFIAPGALHRVIISVLVKRNKIFGLFDCCQQTRLRKSEIAAKNWYLPLILFTING